MEGCGLACLSSCFVFAWFFGGPSPEGLCPCWRVRGGSDDSVVCESERDWADLEGPQSYHVSFCGRSQKHKVPTNGTYNWSPGLILGATCTIFRAGAVPGAPGARRGPQGAEHRPRTRGRIYDFFLPKVCPRERSMKHGIASCHGRTGWVYSRS